MVLAEVPDGATMVGIPARPLGGARAADAAEPVFLPYGMPCEDIPDPIARALTACSTRSRACAARLAELEAAARLRGDAARGRRCRSSCAAATAPTRAERVA